ncbi:MAG: hypothetical protein ACYCS1_11695 [Gammaproteobacteria bacterium]
MPKKIPKKQLPYFKLSVIALLLIILVSIFGVQSYLQLINNNQQTIKNVNYQIPIWNSPMRVSNSQYLFGSMFDTFDNHIILNSSDNITIQVLTAHEFALYATSNIYSAVKTYTGHHIDFWFNDSAGCASYVYVIYSSDNQSFIVYPLITAYYNPAYTATGTC